VAYNYYSCVYYLDHPAAQADPDLVNFYLDGEIVFYVTDCDEGDGWTWYDEDHTQVQFCGDACDQVKNGYVGDIMATFGCDTVVDY
jgi:hypothetical protein